MTIANTKASNVFNANGVTRDFNLGFVYDENVSGISIKVIDTEGTETEVSSNYTIYNGVLTYPTVDSGLDPLAEGYKITIERLTPHTQTIDLIQQGPLDAETLEGGYDKLTMEVQELQDASDRSIKFPVQVEGETDAQAYIDELTALKDTATAAATTATSEAGIATASATAAATSESNAEKWAEGTDAQVAALGGTHSAEGWAGIAQTAAESEDVQTVIANMSDINTVAGISADVTEVASISTAVSNVATHDDDVLLVSDNMASVLTTASNITSVNTVAAAASKVVTVGDNISDVGTVADNVADVSTVATDITKVNTVATDIETIKAVNENKTNIDAVAGNASNITAVAANATNINAVNANKTNIDTVAGSATNINTVATNISDVTSVATSIADVSAVAADLTNINEVADDLENIDIVADSVPYKWQKPADWVDIRSSANWNSAIFLVGHKADYSKYPSFTMKAQVSNSGTYDVFVDGIKQATTASGTATTLTWQTLSLTSGYDVTYPEALRTHIVRIAPSLGTNTITRLEGNVSNQGTLWAHITATNAIRYEYTFKNNAALEAVTTPTGELLVDWYPGIFLNCTSLKTNPVINCATSGNYYDTFAFQNTRVKKITIKNATINYSTDSFRDNPNLEEVELINSKMQFDNRSFYSCHKLKNIPQIWLVGNHNFYFINPGLTGLENTFLDFSLDTGRVSRIDVSGTSTNRVDGLKGLVVSPSSPLADSTSPQIDVQYTGLDRQALVNLFNSMPYNVGYTVVGSPTITNGVVSNVDGQNYLKINGTYNSGTSPFEVQADITTASVLNTYSRILNLPGISLWTQGGVGSLKLDITTTNSNSISFSQGYQPSTRYVIKLVYDGANSYAFYVNNTLVSTQTGQPPNFSSTTWYTYYLAYADTVSGTTISMDLNNTYININGVPWFTGKAAMTKTCNVVGCTGTADLTAEDKAIATDKGWALTLS